MQTWFQRPYCNVDTGVAFHEGVSVRWMPGRTTAQIMKLEQQLEERPGAVGVIDLGNDRFLIDFADGTQWRIEGLKQPCGCG